VTAVGVIAVVGVVWYFVNERIHFNRFELEPRTAFGRSFPSSKEVERSLFNTTVLNSREDGAVNFIVYFDEMKRLVRWSENGVVGGWWSLEPHLFVLTRDNQWRVAVVQVFCVRYTDPMLGYCYFLEDLSQILRYGTKFQREQRIGNIFQLAEGRPPPFRMPKGAVTIDQLLEMLNSKVGSQE